MSSKGFATRAAKDLVDKLADRDEPCTVFCVHDADASGTLIHQTFQEATKARGARKVQIVNLGLEPWEAIEIGLEVERIPAAHQSKPVADYVRKRSSSWETWLQTQRVELNAMTTPAFIVWLDAKMAEHGGGKLIPPTEIIEKQLNESLEEKVRSIITERVLRDAGIDAQVWAALHAMETPSPNELANGIRSLFEREPESAWRAHIEAVANDNAELVRT
jgi:hypothetical protein